MSTASAGTRARILYVTDYTYEARGRRYCDEDIYLSGRMGEEFDVVVCHPRDAAAMLDGFDAVVIRNSGPVMHYQETYDAFRARARELKVPVYNPLDGRGDMAGKQYLVDMSRAGLPVIPTVDRAADLRLLPEAAEYAVKPKAGADSVGLFFTPVPVLPEGSDGTLLVQPRIDFRYEVSFYFIDHDFQYALYAPDTERRWVLEPYAPSPADLEFARTFVRWNSLTHGVQRVDACRTPEGELLLVELEDLNPYLSLDRVTEEVREAFVAGMKASVRRLLA
ncbi:hypothetical protein F0344_03040 [Streptomyces finlayi]|uniref:ATP-grasp domain-containing protein n=1 Tax=Streptomyces finlayi TaxID=67296 RepID=A0A7G7BEF6_9ACTN|nr:hypothetical protein [Streptomyces finlayi]QNE73721.1 hypothetical protein F0344_03040 [Streptomyces finlayi]